MNGDPEFAAYVVNLNAEDPSPFKLKSDEEETEKKGEEKEKPSKEEKDNKKKDENMLDIRAPPFSRPAEAGD